MATKKIGYSEAGKLHLFSPVSPYLNNLPDNRMPVTISQNVQLHAIISNYTF